MVAENHSFALFSIIQLTIVQGESFHIYSILDKHMWGVRRVALTPLTTKTDTGSNSKNNERNSQKNGAALLRKSTKSTVVPSGDFPSPPSLSLCSMSTKMQNI